MPAPSDPAATVAATAAWGSAAVDGQLAPTAHDSARTDRTHDPSSAPSLPHPPSDSRAEDSGQVPACGRSHAPPLWPSARARAAGRATFCDSEKPTAPQRIHRGCPAPRCPSHTPCLSSSKYRPLSGPRCAGHPPASAAPKRKAASRLGIAAPARSTHSMADRRAADCAHPVHRSRATPSGRWPRPHRAEPRQVAASTALAEQSPVPRAPSATKQPLDRSEIHRQPQE